MKASDGNSYPVAIASERAALGACLEDESILRAAIDEGLESADFSSSEYSRLWQAMVDMAAKDYPIDPVSVLDYLGGGQFDAAMIGEVTWGTVVHLRHVLHHVRTIRKKSRLRGLLRLSEWIRNEAIEPHANPDEIARLALQTWREIPPDIKPTSKGASA